MKKFLTNLIFPTANIYNIPESNSLVNTNDLWLHGNILKLKNASVSNYYPDNSISFFNDKSTTGTFLKNNLLYSNENPYVIYSSCIILGFTGYILDFVSNITLEIYKNNILVSTQTITSNKFILNNLNIQYSALDEISLYCSCPDKFGNTLINMFIKYTN